MVKKLLFVAVLFLSSAAVYAQVPSMPDAANVGSAAKGGAVAEAMTDSVAPQQMGQTPEAAPSRNTVWRTAVIILIVAAAAGVAIRYSTKKNAGKGQA